MTYLIIDCQNEVVSTEDGFRDFETKADAEAYDQSLPIHWNAPRKIVDAAEWYRPLELEIGQNVEGGTPNTEDYDTGKVVEIKGNKALVSWASGTRTWTLVDDLSPI